MKVITEKKINKWIVIAALYLALAFGYFVPARGEIALMAANYGIPSWLNNDVAAFISAGLMPLLLYELITSVVFRFVHARGIMKSEDMRYALRFFFIGAGLVMGCVKLIFMFYPLTANFAFVLIDTLIPTLFFGLYLWFVLKHYTDKTRYGKILYELGGTFVLVYGVIALLELIMGVL